jgi:CDP-diacylglycerol--serine O-phosphatidyltransferase
LDSKIPQAASPLKPLPRRGVYVLPSLFTLGTLICGYIAILSTLNGAQMLAAHMGSAAVLAAFDDAAKKIGWAIVFDGLDGRIARLTNSSSDFGKEFDSLADVIAFGVAPALLAYAWGVRAVQAVDGAHFVFYLQKTGWIVAFAFVLCGAARLARFNIDKGSSADRRYFVGMPIPAGAGVVAAIVHWVKSPVNNWVAGILWLAVVGSTAFLMVSRVRYFSFKRLDLGRQRPFFYIIIFGIVIWAVWTYSEPVLLVIASVYALSGPIARLISRIHPHPPAATSRGSAGEEAPTA